jgi:hypothetical protein
MTSDPVRSAVRDPLAIWTPLHGLPGIGIAHRRRCLADQPAFLGQCIGDAFFIAARGYPDVKSARRRCEVDFLALQRCTHLFPILCVQLTRRVHLLTDFGGRQAGDDVGVEIVISKIVGKSKLSQNREERDRIGAAEALRARGEFGTAMRC